MSYGINYEKKIKYKIPIVAGLNLLISEAGCVYIDEYHHSVKYIRRVKFESIPENKRYLIPFEFWPVKFKILDFFYKNRVWVTCKTLYGNLDFANKPTSLETLQAMLTVLYRENYIIRKTTGGLNHGYQYRFNSETEKKEYKNN